MTILINFSRNGNFDNFLPVDFSGHTMAKERILKGQPSSANSIGDKID